MRILLKKIIYKFFNYPIDIFFFLKDLFFFKLLKKNSYRSYNMMVRFFFMTGGFSNDIINFFVSKKPIEKKKTSGILSKFSENEILKHKKNLEDNGYIIFDNILSSEEVNILVNDFLKIEGHYTSDSNLKSHKKILDINNPESVKFYYNSQDVINNTNVHKILFDCSIISFSQLYLNSYPVIDNVSAWWSFPSAQPDKNAAQWWHFDLDRPKWLKFFFFLTDCSIENGAHSFVRGSHKNNGIPWSLRKKGYVRLDDNDVEKKFSKKDIIDMSATKGSLLIEDTRGLHKGRHLIKNNRFLLQVQYSSSLFGGAVENFIMPKLNNHTKEVINEYEYTYSLFK
jgi:ectoine hydroxylase-related dioxygenase (phytanoyl-CoA dioxygenase family)